MRIKVLTPTIDTKSFDGMLRAMSEQDYGQDVVIKHDYLDVGPTSVENFTSVAAAIPDLLKKAVQAESEGFDGIVINCVSDPGQEVLREALKIPVLGTGIAAMHLASLLGTRFAILDPACECHTYVRYEITKYGMKELFQVYKDAGVCVLDIEKDPDQVLTALTRAAIEAIQVDKADALMFGCGAFSQYTAPLDKALRDQGFHLPLIDPLPHTIRLLTTVIRCGLSHSKVAYPNVAR